MSEDNRKKYSYTILLGSTLLLAALIYGVGILFPGEIGKGPEIAKEENRLDREEDGEEPPAVTPPGGETPIPAVTEPPENVQVPMEPVVYQADTSYFEDALFIGDSRTVGLHEYGDLGGAEVIADSGMSVYKVFQKSWKLSDGTEGTLEELLENRRFGKIYIMLGINELGYDFHTTVVRYGELIDRIRELQPNAVLFLEGNLHITKAKSERSDVYNNEKINRFNEAVADLANEREVFYLDVNELFDDEEGNLDPAYTADESHPLGKYYSDWVNWILEHAVRYVN